jgi:CheY-like chemotaxis protein
MELTNLKILIAEDDIEDGANIKSSLEQDGTFVKIDLVEDGEQLMDFLNAIRNDLPSVILTDLNMPKKDGYEVLFDVSQDGDFSKIPVIVYTTSSSQYCFTKCKELGATEIIVKPFSFKEIKNLPAQIIEILRVI